VSWKRRDRASTLAKLTVDLRTGAVRLDPEATVGDRRRRRPPRFVAPVGGDRAGRLPPPVRSVGARRDGRSASGRADLGRSCNTADLDCQRDGEPAARTTRYDLLERWEPEVGLEPTTCCLQDSCSGQLSYPGTMGRPTSVEQPAARSITPSRRRHDSCAHRHRQPPGGRPDFWHAYQSGFCAGCCLTV
jgi:hypothetical protein